MQHLNTNDHPGISKDIIGTGSAFEGLKVKPEIEFDFMIPISIKTVVVHSCRSNKSPTPGIFLDKMCDDGYLSAKAVREWFQSLADRAANMLKKRGINLKFLQQGPARTLKIMTSGEVTISIDLVPAVKYQNVYLVAKTYEGYLPESSKDIVWRLSFSVQEKAFLEQKTLSLPKNACHKKALQILKYLKQEERNSKRSPPHWCTSLSYYHLKTLWLHQLHKTPTSQWHDNQLKERVAEILDHLIGSLESETLYHFFMGNTELTEEAATLCIPRRFLRTHLKSNLYDGIHPDTMYQALLQLKSIQISIDSYVENLLLALSEENRVHFASNIRII
ncbi:inositol 1,4,5-trisphosphate receptor-interacting protein-like [Protopterus annectens]|uniref:inositol 1,4,5-trisphosphate receptor-interacting protein-like n=1 Tax=Protopterus annectens TaxID=7888 RepID=UPI001CFB9426|nr:inositol 1,4,5-trisphosphate receptor-interacting protein-like [Protopterus annectens]